ncbi:MAG: amidohydrolase [Planctomycetes bacterium]|nr:amidohydrolase [Planctomycetota bacterium]
MLAVALCCSFRLASCVAGLLVLLSLVASAARAQATAPREGPREGRRDAACERFLAAELPGLLDLYRELHRHPELSFREVKTAARIAGELQRAGLDVTRNVGGLGVVGVLRNGEGPCVLLRTDLDALPLGEETPLDYRSEVRTESPDGRVAGVMHACGHDLHMASFAGTVRFLAAHRELWSGTVVAIGQPAEERAGGAQAMLDDGLFERFPRPDYALALHVTQLLETGQVGYCAGPAMANVTSCDVTVRGRGGHGAAPHLTIDPIVLAAKLVLDLQTIVSREIDPVEPAVVTVGAIEGGTKHNIIDDDCRLQITIRSYSADVHERIQQAIVRKARAVAMSADAPEPEVRFSEFTPALVNDADLVARVVPALQDALGDDAIVPFAPAMTAEDFGRFRLAGVPIFMFRLGTIAPARMAEYRSRGEEPPPLHSPHYWPDAEASLRAGIVATTAAVRELLPPRR